VKTKKPVKVEITHLRIVPLFAIQPDFAACDSKIREPLTSDRSFVTCAECLAKEEKRRP